MGFWKNVKRNWGKLKADRYERSMERRQIAEARRQGEFEGRLAGAKREGYQRGVRKGMTPPLRERIAGGLKGAVVGGGGKRKRGGLRAVGRYLFSDIGGGFDSSLYGFPSASQKQRKRRKKRR